MGPNCNIKRFLLLYILLTLCKNVANIIYRMTRAMSEYYQTNIKKYVLFRKKLKKAKGIWIKLWCAHIFQRWGITCTISKIIVSSILSMQVFLQSLVIFFINHVQIITIHRVRQIYGNIISFWNWIYLIWCYNCCCRYISFLNTSILRFRCLNYINNIISMAIDRETITSLHKKRWE